MTERYIENFNLSTYPWNEHNLNFLYIKNRLWKTPIYITCLPTEFDKENIVLSVEYIDRLSNTFEPLFLSSIEANKGDTELRFYQIK